MRAIDADALRECYTDLDDNLKVPVAICKANIDSMPTIEAEPIRHGHWIDEGLVDGCQNRYCRCSECGKGDTQAISQRVPYCWWCGAKMSSGENE